MVNEKNKIHVNTINYWRHYRGKNNFKKKNRKLPNHPAIYLQIISTQISYRECYFMTTELSSPL